MNLTLHLGNYEEQYQKSLAKAAEDNLVARIWAHDHRVWQPTPDEIGNRLGWLDIAERMQSELPALEDFAKEIKEAGFEQVLLLGMGGSSLAPQVISRILGPAAGYPGLHILDSTDPAAVQASANKFDPAKTLYVVATKSGGTVETLSFFKYFYNQVSAKVGEGQAGAHFAAITDPSSKLVDLAAKFNFRRSFENDPNIGGRYSAVSHFGLVPAALLGLDQEALLEKAIRSAEACRSQDPAHNPGLQLGLALSTLAKADRDKLTFVADDKLASFADWAEQLIAESTGKSGTGILPVAHEQLGEAGVYGKDRVFLSLNLDEDSSQLDALQAAGHPAIQVDWENLQEIGAHFFLWEFATAVAGHGLGIHPFNQPNVESAKKQARALVDAYVQDGELPQPKSSQPSAEHVGEFLTSASEGDYIALQAFIQPTDAARTAVHQLQATLRDKYQLATTVGFGPRFLHSTGQLHKGDAGNGHFIQLVTPPPNEDVDIPIEAGSSDSEISFGVLKYAQAAGDAQALHEAGRPVLTLEIKEDPVKVIKELERDIRD